MNCDLCGNPIADKKIGAHAKRFCDDTCRADFWRGLKIVGQRMFEAGIIDRLSIQKAARPSCTTPQIVSQAAE